MQHFINQLRSAPEPYDRLGVRQRSRLVENLLLDAHTLQPTGWCYPPGMPANRGGNITHAMLAEVTRRLNAAASGRTTGGTFSTLLNEAGQALNPLNAAGSPDHFCRVAASAPCPGDRLWTIIKLSTLQYSFTARGAWQKTLYDWLHAPDPASCPVQPKAGQIGLGPPGSLFWFSDQSPLDVLASKGLAVNTREAAMAVLKELALPGFETRKRQKEAMALVCVEFARNHLVDRGAVGQVWKPTAIDALNYKGYLFLPGRIRDRHGLTWPLQNNLRKHENRDGLREFIHPRIEVPALEGGRRTVQLIGFLDPDEQATWNSYA